MKTMIALCALLAGCATATPIFTPDGRKGFAIDCSGGGLTWAECMQKAGEICGSAGYDTFTQNGDQSLVATNGFAAMSATRSMTIACH